VISSSVGDDALRAEAKRLLGKMLLHCPKPDPLVILGDAQEEERKRGKRLAAKNGKALGSMVYNPPTTGTSEHVQRLEPLPSGE